jgi:hypothetical protein
MSQEDFDFSDVEPEKTGSPHNIQGWIGKLKQLPTNQKWIFGGCGLLLFFCCCCCGGGIFLPSGGDQSAIRNPEEGDVISIHASTLFNIYEENDINGDQKYKGKVLEITGSVDGISRGFFDEIYITLNTGEFKIFTVQCYFAEDFADRAGQLRKGEFVRVRGRCDGKVGNVIIKDCVLVE